MIDRIRLTASCKNVPSFYFSMTIWNLKEARFVGLENFITFFSMTNTRTALINTAIFALTTCSVKIIGGLLLARYVSSGIRSGNYLKIVIFFPYLLGNVVVALAFRALLEPAGTVNQFLQFLGFDAVRWLTDKHFALLSCIIADIWKGIGTVTIILIAGMCAIPKSYYEEMCIRDRRWSRSVIICLENFLFSSSYAANPFCRARLPSLLSAFYRAGRHTLQDFLVQEYVQQDQRKGNHDRRRK